MAMTVFSFMLLIIVVGFLNIIHLYENSQVSRSVQHDTRFGMEEMIRTARGSSNVKADASGVCFYGSAGSHRFSVSANQLIENSLSVTQPTPVINCAAEPPTGAAQVLSSTDVIVVGLTGTEISSADVYKSVQLELKIKGSSTTGNTLNGTRTACQPQQPFCNLTVISSTASMRGSSL